MADDDRSFEYFLEVYGTLPRAGPGGDDHTRRALDSVPVEAVTVLDLGCGPGQQSLVLADALSGAEIRAIDVLPSMVDEANRRFRSANLGHRVRAEVGDMAAPAVEPGTQDLVWAEGSIYNVGVTEALTAWQPLLRPGGGVAFTEVVWLADPPDELREWWMAEYPAISDAAGVVDRIRAASFDLVDSFVLPASAWWDEYYTPMRARIAELRQRRADDPVALEIAAQAELEVDMFERFSDAYSYAFFVVSPA